MFFIIIEKRSVQ